MPPPNPKNIGLGPAATDLGLGGALEEQLSAEEKLRRKKMLEASRGQQGIYGDSTLSNASMAIFGDAGGYK